MDSSDASSFRVPPRRPLLMKELYSKLPGVDDRIRNLADPAAPAEYEDIADALYDVFITARNLAPDRNATGCDIHPSGPVDTEAPEGWTQCLLCNTRRRLGRPEVKAATTARQRTWTIPEPPYTRAVLDATMRELNDAVQDLDYRSADDAFAMVADMIHAAFSIAREMSRPLNSSHCTRHPGAPVDPDALDGPQCMFCQGEERRNRVGLPNVVVRPSRPLPRTESGNRDWRIPHISQPER